MLQRTGGMGCFPGIVDVGEDIHSKFGNVLKTFPLVDIFELVVLPLCLRGAGFKPLNLVPYVKVDAENY
jgi:hypothetical protein